MLASAADGDIFLFLDSDVVVADVMETNWLKQLLAALKNGARSRGGGHGGQHGDVCHVSRRARNSVRASGGWQVRRGERVVHGGASVIVPARGVRRGDV